MRSLTDISIRALKPPEKGQVMYWDGSLSGFGVRVSQGGTKTFVVVHGRRRIRTTIGRVGVVKLAEARKKARDVLAEETLGIAATSGPPIHSALDQFLAAYKSKNRASTYEETARLLKRHLTATKRVGDISIYELTDLVQRISAPSEQRHFFVALKTFLNWCAKRRLITTSQLSGLDPPQKPSSRDRVLSEGELTKVLAAARLEPLPYGRIIEILILTGQRVGQIVSLDSSWIDRSTRSITWPAEAMKGDRPHTIPYGERIAELLGNGQGRLFPFKNFSNAKRNFDAKCPIPHWTLHDLRRTARTFWAQMKVPPHIAERVLAHSTGGQSAIAAVYDRYLYLDEMREAMKAWEAKLVSLVSG